MSRGRLIPELQDADLPSPNVRELLCGIIEQAIWDYRMLRAHGYVLGLRPTRKLLQTQANRRVAGAMNKADAFTAMAVFRGGHHRRLMQRCINFDLPEESRIRKALERPSGVQEDGRLVVRGSKEVKYRIASSKSAVRYQRSAASDGGEQE